MTATVTETVKPDAHVGYRVAQRVVFPNDGDLDALPLYIDKPWGEDDEDLHPEDLLGRTRLLVRPGCRLSLGSYFNAFPASYWRRWTVVTTVRLQVRTRGAGVLIVYKSDSRGHHQRVTQATLEGEATSSFDLPLDKFGDGGWYWFDLAAGGEPLELDRAEWLVPEDGRARGRVSLAVTTFNRPDYCTRTIGMVAADPVLRSILDELIIVDQGTQKVRDDAGFKDVAALMGHQLTMVDQPNIGGSGGFARGMYEALTRGASAYVILLDDDIILETESISRMTTFADMCRTPTIVGGHMFDIYNRSLLHTFGEVIDPFGWLWELPSDDQWRGHSFQLTGLRQTSWMHQRVDVDFNGWWMCLIPIKVVEQIGLSLPVFIKWDDVEYSLRARQVGVPTVSLPGSAVWHVSWIDKDDLVGWQAYFHARNRLITALMYSPFGRGKNTLYKTLLLDLHHILGMQYYTESGRVMALEDVLGGPEHLHDLLPRRLTELRTIASQFPDAAVRPQAGDFPPVRHNKPLKSRSSKQGTPSWMLAARGTISMARQAFTPVDSAALKNPQQQIPHVANRWYNLIRTDSALVSTAEGTGASWYQRDSKKTRDLTGRSGVLHARILADWKSLRRRYIDARDDITSVAAWEKTFGIERTDGK